MSDLNLDCYANDNSYFKCNNMKVNILVILAMFCYFVLYPNIVQGLYGLTIIIENIAMPVCPCSLINVAHRPLFVIPQPLYRNDPVHPRVLGDRF